jgi:hypothetical protein
MQRKVVAVSTKGRHDNMHLVLHKPGNEVHNARQTVEPPDHQLAARGTRLLERRRKPLAQQQSILTGAGLNVLKPFLYLWTPD